MKNQKKIAIIGFGGLGVPVFLRILRDTSELHIEVFDSDTVDISNLPRQILFTEKDISKYKLDVLQDLLLSKTYAEYCRNKEIKLNKIRISKDHLSKLDDFEILIDCTDDAAFKFELNDYCKLKNKTLIHGGAQGEHGLAFTVSPKGPCLRCLFGNPDTMSLEELCTTCRTTGILGAYSGLTGIYQAELALRVLKNEITTKAFKIDSRGVLGIEVAKDEDCPICFNGKKLDLREVKCPETFVYAKLALLKRNDPSERMLIQFNNADDLESVQSSILDEGFKVISPLSQTELNAFHLLVS